MKAFMDKDFLLSGEIAKTLYHEYAAKTPILDYHCHIDPAKIAGDHRFDNITQLWLGGDHYKWRYMRSCGVDEAYITGDASDKEKFLAWAATLGKAIGNPLFHWSHLELQRYFDFYGVLNKNTAEEVWTLCNEKLTQDSMSVRNLIRQSHVTLICTTDDPLDSLVWHGMINRDKSFSTQVLPTWRPDKAMNIEKADFIDYIEQLSETVGMRIASITALQAALENRMDHFDSMGCRLSDHGLDYVMYVPTSIDEINTIFQKRLSGRQVTKEEALKFKTAFMLFSGKEYSKRNWVMQLHYGCKRNNNSLMYDKIGADAGFDCINNFTPSSQLTDFLDALAQTFDLPKTIIYSLNPNDNPAIGTIIGCFQDSSAAAKIQQGSAWWFNDHKTGIREQILSLANLGNLSGFIGMLTDSRSFLSYTRHEYFRRILCDIIGEFVENGEFPNDMKLLSEIVKDISYYNAVRYLRVMIKD